MNLKDEKNDYFWRNVLQGEISTSMLIRMENQDMASKEKMEWREQLEREDIERRKKIEEERQKEVFSRLCCSASLISFLRTVVTSNMCTYCFLSPKLLQSKPVIR